MTKTDQLLLKRITQKYGTQKALARHCKLSESAVSLWKVNGIPKAWKLVFKAELRSK